MKKRLSAIAATAFSGLFAIGAVPATADEHAKESKTHHVSEPETYLSLMVGAYRFDKHDEHDTLGKFTPGIGIEHVGAFSGDGGLRYGVTGGLYYDRIKRISVYAGGIAEACSSPRRAFMLCAGGALGVVTNEHEMPIAPLVEPFGKIEHSFSGVFVKLSLVPPIKEPATLVLETGFRF